MKKVLFVNSSLTSGGSEKVMTLIANGFAKRNYDVSMVLLYNYGYDTYEIDKKINLIRFKCEHKIKIIKKIRQVRELRKVIKNGKFDYIVSFMQSINIVTLIAGMGLKQKIIVSERCNPAVRKNVIKNFLSDILYKKCYKLVLQTQDVKKYFNDKLQSRSVVIPNPVDVNLPNPYSGKREKRVVAVGRLTTQKNFPMLINTFAKFSKNNNDYVLEIYGDGPLLSNLKQCAQDNNISEKIIFKGYVKDVLQNIMSAGMYVSSSDYEGISNSMIEALAIGIPTICTDCPVGGARMMIKNEENGILVPVGDDDALLDAMNRVASDNKFADKISKNSIKIRDDYSIDKITDMWENIMKW